MNAESQSLLLVGVGGYGSSAVRGICRACGSGIRAITVDSDASTGAVPGVPFVLIGGERLSGLGSGGHAAEARVAFLDNPEAIDQHLTGVRLAIVAASLGGGTGGGATAEIAKRLAAKGIVSIVFAALPFSFEGENRTSAARTALSAIEHAADATVPMSLDSLVSGTDNTKEALGRAADALSAALSLFWRLLEQPGYISLDVERLRTAVAGAGRGRFATASATGEKRAENALASLAASLNPQRDGARPRARSVLLGILAGDDLRLSEVAFLANGTRNILGKNAAFNLGTVNDEDLFSGRLAAVALAFDEAAVRPDAPAHAARASARTKRGSDSALAANDMFAGLEKTVWHDEDLDIPTYLRKNLTLER